MNKQQLQQLKSELQTDPEGIGYDLNASHEELAKRVNQTPRPIQRDSLSGGLLFGAIVIEELALLSPIEKEYVTLAVQVSEIPLTSTVRTQFAELFPNRSRTRANILDAMRQEGSRAQELGLGRVSPSDVADALLRT